MPGDHARLSPSAAGRWLSCPASVLLVEAVVQPDVEQPASPWAVEGTEAHELAFLEASKVFGQISDEDFVRKLGEWELRNADRGAHVLAEMSRHVREYIALLRQALKKHPQSQIRLEKRMPTGVPHCWGTADAIIFSPRHVHVIDLKYGQGVKVEAFKNPQLMLYGCAALDTYGDVLGETEEVEVTIYQPRAQHGGGVSTYTLSADELRAWREYEVIPVAEQALKPGAPFGPSEKACRFCPVAGECRARMEAALAQDFGTDPDILSPEEIGAALDRVAEVRAWCDALEERAMRKAYNERVHIPGWKVVRGSGRRSVSAENIPHAIQILIDEGYTAEQVARFSLKPLGELERLIGKKELPTILGELLTKSQGNPALVPESDNRPAIDPNSEARKEFSDVEGE